MDQSEQCRYVLPGVVYPPTWVDQPCVKVGGRDAFGPCKICPKRHDRPSGLWAP